MKNKKKKQRSRVVVFLTAFAMALSNVAAFAYVATDENGGVNVYTLPSSVTYSKNDTDTSLTLSRFSDAAVYTDTDGTEYVYAMNFKGSNGVFGFKRNAPTEEGQTVTFDSISLNAIDYRVNIYHCDIAYNNVDVIDGALYLVNQKQTKGNPNVVKYSLSDPAAPKKEVVYGFSNQGLFKDYKIDGNKLYAISTQGFGILDFSQEAQVRTEYSFSDCADENGILPGIDATCNGSIEAQNGYVYISGQYTDAESKVHLCVWALKETDNGLTLLGMKEYLTATGVYTIDSIIVNDTLYISAKGDRRDFLTGIFAVDITVPENFANAACKNNMGSNALNNTYRIKQGYGMKTDGRYLFVADPSTGITVFDTLGGVDLLPVGGSQEMQGTSIDIVNGKVYQIDASSTNTDLYVWDYSIADENTRIGYAYNGNNASRTEAGTPTTTANGLDGDLIAYSGISGNNSKLLQVKNDSDITITYTVTSPVACEKKLYLQTRLRGAVAAAAVTVNDSTVYTTEELVSDSGSRIRDVYLCDVSLNKGTNTIAINIKGSGENPSGDNIQIGGIALSYETAQDTGGLSFAKTEFLTAPSAGAKVIARTQGWQTLETPVDSEIYVIYAAYDGNGVLEAIHYETIAFEGFRDRDYVDVELEIPTTSTEIRRFLFTDLDTAYPVADCEIITLQ